MEQGIFPDFIYGLSGVLLGFKIYIQSGIEAEVMVALALMRMARF